MHDLPLLGRTAAPRLAQGSARPVRAAGDAELTARQTAATRTRSISPRTAISYVLVAVTPDEKPRRVRMTERSQRALRLNPETTELAAELSLTFFLTWSADRDWRVPVPVGERSPNGMAHGS